MVRLQELDFILDTMKPAVVVQELALFLLQTLVEELLLRA